MPLNVIGWLLKVIWPCEVLSPLLPASIAPLLGGGGGAGAAMLSVHCWPVVWGSQMVRVYLLPSQR